MSLSSIINQIATGAVKVWDAVEADINTDVAKIEAVLGPTFTTSVQAIGAVVKQGASDLIGTADSALNTLAPTVTKTVEAAADAALTTYTGGLAIALVPATNDAIEGLEGLIVATANAWALKAKAALAENNAATGAPPTAEVG